MLKHVGYIDLPRHTGAGGFDHAAIHAATSRIYLAHTANDAVDVIDTAAGKYLFSVEDLAGVAGVLVSDELGLVITSNRAENTIAMFEPVLAPRPVKVSVGLRPNGLACDPVRRLVLAANVGDPSIPGSHTLSVVGIDERRMIAEIGVPGRTRWAVYDAAAQVFYVNIADPPEIVVIDARDPRRIARTFAIPAAGPHGLDLDAGGRRLHCACDARVLVTLDAATGAIERQQPLSGVPDVVFFNPRRERLYVAAGDPGVIDVFDTAAMKPLGPVATEQGAHTIALSLADDRIYAFLPRTNRAAVYEERED